MVEVMTNPHVSIAEKLVRAAYSHGRIICNRRLSEYKCLLDQIGDHLIDVLYEVAAISGNHLFGEVQVDLNKTVTTRSVVIAITGMTLMHVIHSLEFFISGLSRCGNNPQKVYAQYTSLKGSVLEAFKLLDAVIAVDRRWHVAAPAHVTRVKEAVCSIVDRLSQRNRREIEIRSDLPTTLKKWENDKRQV
jgi:hypothetical protein